MKTKSVLRLFLLLSLFTLILGSNAMIMSQTTSTSDENNESYDDEIIPYEHAFMESISDSTLRKNMNKNLKLELFDGSELSGKIKGYDSTTVEFSSLSGLGITIPREQVRSISPMRGEIIDGEYVRFDPNWTRLFFAPTGRPIKAGEGYFAVYEIFFPFLAIGVTDWMSLSGGISLIPGLDNQLYYANIKVTPVNEESVSLSFGGLTAGIWGENVGIVYSCVTLGDNRNSITGGIGLGYNEDGFTDLPVFMLGFELGASNSLKLISENWLVDEVGVFMFGMRFFGDHLSADFGLLTTTEASGSFPFFPWLSFSYNFGN